MRHYNLAQNFYLNSINKPARTALVVGKKIYSYKDLAAKTCDLAAWLVSECQEAGARVGIMASRSLAAYVGVLAASWAGKTYVPLNPNFPTAYLEKLIERTKVKVLVVDRETEDHLESRAQGLNGIISISPCSKPELKSITGEHSFINEKKLFPPVEVSSKDLLYIMFTSGTSGEPKMIGASALNVAHFLEASQSRYKLVAGDRVSQFNDLCWDPSVFDIFAAWAVGAAVYVVPAEQLLAPANFIKKNCLTVWYSTPSQIELLSRMNLLKPGSLPSLRLSLFVGEPLTASAASQWNKAAPNSLVENVYGPTETTVVCMGQPYDPIRPEIITPKRGYVAIGTPYHGVQVALINRDQQFLREGEVGELVISGPTVAPGYLGKPELTAQQFVDISHPELGKSTWYLTGDRGYQDHTGIFHFLGRGDNQVQILGKRVELEEVEFHLRQVAGCEEAVVVGWPVKDGSVQSLVGFVSGTKDDALQLKRALQKRLPAYMVPRKINILAAMPRNRNGKLDRKAILKYVTEAK
jgi:amino acid adenylation domain-containing protein